MTKLFGSAGACAFRFRQLIRLPASFVIAGFAGLAGSALAQSTVTDTIEQRTVACIACHGKEGRATPDGYYPRIAGKPAGYLYNQLINFREGRRQYPLMIYMVDHLSDGYLREIAGYFSSLHPPYPPPQAPDVAPAVLEKGRVLAHNGDPSRNVPACVACHGQSMTGVEPAIPGLLGLPRDYLNSQLGAWKSGLRRAAQPDCMAQIAGRLSADDISAVSGWLASRPFPENAVPPTVSEKLPMQCGSVPR
jgi:cytochrome c553